MQLTVISLMAVAFTVLVVVVRARLPFRRQQRRSRRKTPVS
jgi:hypothetical protein